MNNTILVTTDFSDTSRNALDYACALAADTGKEVLLTHIYVIPTAYAGDGLSLVTIDESMESETKLLQEEKDRVTRQYPNLKLSTSMTTGNFVESLCEMSATIRPSLVIIGAFGEYSDVLVWENEWLRVIVAVSCPVLVVPSHKKYKRSAKITFACDYKKVYTPLQKNALHEWVQQSGAELHIVHVTQNATAEVVNSPVADQVRRDFSALNPVYHLLKEMEVIEAMAGFIAANEIDMLVVVPRVHSFWHSLFNKSYSKQLARLNNTPVLAIHDMEQ